MAEEQKDVIIFFTAGDDKFEFDEVLGNKMSSLKDQNFPGPEIIGQLTSIRVGRRTRLTDHRPVHASDQRLCGLVVYNIILALQEVFVVVNCVTPSNLSYSRVFVLWGWGSGAICVSPSIHRERYWDLAGQYWPRSDHTVGPALLLVASRVDNVRPCLSHSPCLLTRAAAGGVFDGWTNPVNRDRTPATRRLAEGSSAAPGLSPAVRTAHHNLPDFLPSHAKSIPPSPLAACLCDRLWSRLYASSQTAQSPGDVREEKMAN
ncbi:hypothetical protein RRG08_038192 [Elysia crispata]|uniref:Uncharacterized protein n=1 Tax=Elysia crispata TaxID=231223 RepID=A0AAE1AML6_9GAST|nr:hypothetical protein RRG08_038192 [Elysia crispata]